VTPYNAEDANVFGDPASFIFRVNIRSVTVGFATRLDSCDDVPEGLLLRLTVGSFWCRGCNLFGVTPEGLVSLDV
jgi:hypothetical protein